jgi:glycosyltransferase involved in cell wall biosynthesis
MPWLVCRYERKKNISLAIKAFALLPKELLGKCVLVVAGGYDTNVSSEWRQRCTLHICCFMFLNEEGGTGTGYGLHLALS